MFVLETEERTACPITKASDNTQFHISLIFVLYFHSQFQRFFSLFDAFAHVKNRSAMRPCVGFQSNSWVSPT